MTDLVRALEHAAKAIRGGFQVLGALVDRAVPMKTPAADAAPAVTGSAGGGNPPSSPAVVQHRPARVDAFDRLGPYGRPDLFTRQPEFDWVTWVIPAITEVLADHVPHERELHGGLYCSCGWGKGGPTALDWFNYREHVAPIIAQRIKSAAAQQM